MNDPRVLVLGIGNLLMGDEGVGVHAVRRLSQQHLPEGVGVVDGGTGGFHLLEYFDLYPTIIIIDATTDGKPPGTVSLSEPRYPSDFPKSLTAHDVGLRDMIESAALIGALPRIFLISISVGTDITMTTSLSPQVESSIPEIIRRTLDLLRTWN